MGGQKHIRSIVKFSFGSNVQLLMWALTDDWGQMGKTPIKRRVGIAETGKMGTLWIMHAIPYCVGVLNSGAGQSLGEGLKGRGEIMLLKDTHIGKQLTVRGHRIRSIRVSDKRESTPLQEGCISTLNRTRKQGRADSSRLEIWPRNPILTDSSASFRICRRWAT